MRPGRPRRSLIAKASANPRRRLRIEGNAFAGRHAAEDLDLAAFAAAGPHLAQHAACRPCRSRRRPRAPSGAPAPAKARTAWPLPCRRPYRRRGSHARANMPGAASVSGGRSRRNSSVWLATSTVGSSWTWRGLTQPAAAPGISACGASAPPTRATAVCGIAAVTRSAAGSYRVKQRPSGHGHVAQHHGHVGHHAAIGRLDDVEVGLRSCGPGVGQMRGRFGLRRLEVGIAPGRAPPG